MRCLSLPVVVVLWPAAPRSIYRARARTLPSRGRAPATSSSTGREGTRATSPPRETSRQDSCGAPATGFLAPEVPNLGHVRDCADHRPTDPLNACSIGRDRAVSGKSLRTMLVYKIHTYIYRHDSFYIMNKSVYVPLIFIALTQAYVCGRGCVEASPTFRCSAGSANAAPE